MSAVKPDLSDIVNASQRTLAARIHTSIPGEVVSYNPTTNTADIKIAVKDFVFDTAGDRTYDEALVFPSVLVMWPRGGGKIVRLPLVAGDTVNLLFAERSLAEWRASGQTSEPLDSRRLSYGYPVASPGLFPDVKPLSPADAVEVALGAMIIGEDGGDEQILIGGSVPGVRFGKLAVAPIALGPPVVSFMAAVAAWIALAGPKIVTIPAPLTGPEQTALTTATGTVATAAGVAASGTNSTLVKSV